MMDSIPKIYKAQTTQQDDLSHSLSQQFFSVTAEKGGPNNIEKGGQSTKYKQIMNSTGYKNKSNIEK